MYLSKSKLFFIAAILLLTGCATTSTNNQVDGSNLNLEQIESIAANLTNAATQIKELTPQITTVQFNSPNSDLGTAILQNLQSAGYGIQMVSNDQGKHYVSYKAEDSVTELGARLRYSMSIGNVILYRDFQKIDNMLAPNSPLFIEGINENQIIVANDSIFGFTEEDDVYIGDINITGITPVIAATDDTSVATNSVFKNLKQVSQNAKVIKPNSNNAAVPLNRSFGNSKQTAKKAVKENIFYTDESNYVDIFNDYRDVTKVTLVFDNESLRLGKLNKAAINNLTKLVDPKTDLVSIVGCSHGRTSLKNGNGVLAVGRANRVKEAFIVSGIDQDLLYEEGCWANGRYHEDMPKRGVVVAIKRKLG